MHATLRILVVEDEPLVRMDLAEHLSDRGFEVLEAGNADEAIAFLESNLDIRLLITDIDMPGSIDGLKLAAAVRERWPPVKIIVVSGHRVVEITDIPDGSVFFAKPYTPSHILTSMHKLLSE